MWVAAELGCFRSSHSNSLQRSFVLAGPQTALRDDMVQLRVVGIGGQRAVQLGNGLGVHAGAVVAHPQQGAPLQILGIHREGRAERSQGGFEISQLELGQSQVQLNFPDVRFNRKRLTIAVRGFLVMLLLRKREARICQGWNVGRVVGGQGLAPRSAARASRKANGQQNAACVPPADHEANSVRGAGPVESRNTSSGSRTISRPGNLPRADSGTSMLNARWPIRSRGMCNVVSGG